MKRKEEAEDATQETFVKIYLNAKKFRVEESGRFVQKLGLQNTYQLRHQPIRQVEKEILASSSSGHKRFGRKSA